MTKQELRKRYLSKRKALNETELKMSSERICQQFFENVDLARANVIDCFLPIRKNNEPDTWLIIERLRRDFPRIEIATPLIDEQTGRLDHILLEPNSAFHENKWGIPEISNGKTVDVKAIDMVLIPLLVFDLSGNRVGYGKGFYDRFLSECRAKTLRIGISLFEGVEVIEDINDFDQPMHLCITPNKIHSF